MQYAVRKLQSLSVISDLKTKAVFTSYGTILSNCHCRIIDADIMELAVRQFFCTLTGQILRPNVNPIETSDILFSCVHLMLNYVRNIRIAFM
jgi:hypothetical protein